MDEETITIPKSFLKVLQTQAVITMEEMAHVNVADVMAHAKASMARSLAEKLMETATFEVHEIALGMRFRVKIRLIEEDKVTTQAQLDVLP